jgi:hypothetical protein
VKWANEARREAQEPETDSPAAITMGLDVFHTNASGSGSYSASGTEWSVRWRRQVKPMRRWSRPSGAGRIREMEVGIDRIGMDLQEVSNFYGGQTGSIKQDRCGPSALAGHKRTFQHLVKLPDV